MQRQGGNTAEQRVEAEANRTGEEGGLRGSDSAGTATERYRTAKHRMLCAFSVEPPFTGANPIRGLRRAHTGEGLPTVAGAALGSIAIAGWCTQFSLTNPVHVSGNHWAGPSKRDLGTARSAQRRICHNNGSPEMTDQRRHARRAPAQATVSRLYPLVSPSSLLFIGNVPPTTFYQSINSPPSSVLVPI